MAAVPLGFALFVLQLAVGGILVTVALDWDGEVSRGFLALNCAFLVAFAAGALWLRSVLPAERLLGYPANPTWLLDEPRWWGAFTALAVVLLALLRTERRRLARAVGLLAGAAGVGALAASATAYRPPGGAFPLLLASLLAGALALGAAWSGMMLGHWYLVTPRLAPRPLVRLTGFLAAVLTGQALLVAGQALAGPGAIAVGAPFTFLFWLRVGVGLLFPLVLCLPVWRTARVRSMMSATGLLYVALGTVLAGEIMAGALFFVTRVPL